MKKCILTDCILEKNQVYAFEREVREVQELVQRRDTFPRGVSLQYFSFCFVFVGSVFSYISHRRCFSYVHLLPILLFDANLCLLCVFIG